MEFHVRLAETLPDAARLAAMIESEDPAAVAELDSEQGLWRVSTCLHPDELVDLLGRAGCPVPYSQVTLLPSVCCGGCSG